MQCKRLLTVALLLTVASSLLADEIALPKAMAWSAYNLGTTGYNQAVGIAKMLKNRHRVTLRVIPGKNDISRLLPLLVGRAQFSANGVATYFAQEGMFQFANRKWGPMPVRMVLMSVGLSNQAVAVPANSATFQMQDLRGKRVPFVRGAPSLNVSTEAMLACGGLGWDDVEIVEFPGYSAMWNGIVDGHVDVAYATTVSGPTRKLEASPAGIRWLPVPHDDPECWRGLLSVAPYFTKHTATRGAAISDAAPHEGATYPYPILMTFADQDHDLVYNLARAINEGFDDHKLSDPGSIGWSIDRQQLQWVVPFHEGAVHYLQTLGVWTEEAQVHQRQLIQRQAVLVNAWQELTALPTDDDEFAELWPKLRALRLVEAGFDPVWQ